jgi:hypothetical protein
MPTRDGFDPDQPVPLFLADEPEQQGIGKAWDRAVIAPRVLKASILVATATAIGIAILWVGNSVTLFADVTTSRVDKSTLPAGADQSAPTIQSTADAQALPPPAKDAPTSDEIAAASDSAVQSQTENIEPSSEVLFRQFQAWAAEKDAHAQVAPVQPVQEAPEQVSQHASVQVAQNAEAPLPPLQRHRHVRPVQNARAEIRSAQNPRKKLRREQDARVQLPPARDARARGESVQNVQAPSLLQTLGLRN